MKYFFALGGGMGDVFRHIMKDPHYSQLDNLTAEDTCDILLVCHNPFAKEFFDWHPKKEQLSVLWHGYWGSLQEPEMRSKYNLPLRNSELPGEHGTPKFYPSPDDLEMLSQFIDQKIIVLSATAGTMDRSIPETLVFEMIHDLKNEGYQIVSIGRNYERWGYGGCRKEIEYESCPDVISMVDKLSVPGTIELIRQSSGVISCHSAACLMAWWFDKPNILVVPKAVSHANGIDKGENNDWTFGIYRKESELVYVEDYQKDVSERFLEKLR